MRPFDVSPEAHEFQLQGYRKMSISQKSELIAELSVMVREFSRTGIRMRHPEYSEAEVTRALAMLIYGEYIAQVMFPGEEVPTP